MLAERQRIAAGVAPAAVARADRVLLRLDRARVCHGDVRILDDITLALPPGPPTVLIGPNGSGKTTLLKLLMGLMPATAGRVELAQDVRAAFVFQRPVMLRRSVADNVAFARRAAGFTHDGGHVLRVLARVGLSDLAQRPARRLSGGEQQRLAIARALAREPALLLLDEPTASLDPAATKAIEDIVEAVAEAGVKVVMATHDLGQARRLAGDVVLLVKGRVAEHALSSQIFTHPATDAARAFLKGDLIL